MRTSLLLLMLLAIGCARDVRTRYPALPEVPTSSVVLLLSDAASGVAIAVNGILVVQDAHTARVVIDNVPTGYAEIVLTANGADKAMRVWVGDDHATTIPMGVPDGGGATGFLKTIFASIVTMAVYALLH
ncbi:MAG: hypothetical protein NT062_22370 [Proteobacteria bacterium]|nr:hypothetical protein [Pseudomonadota bacterium]